MKFRPHNRLNGMQVAGWMPRAQSQAQYKVQFYPDVRIPLPDGTILCGDLYRPKADGRFPLLLAWSPYTKELQNTGIPLPINEVGAVSYFVERGYCHLTVNARGTGKSKGQHTFQFSSVEQHDVVDTIEWAAIEPWCDGNVGMIGMSYFAAIQYLAAAQQPPHLRAIFPYLGFTDFYRHFAYHGGAFQADFFSFYYSLVGSTQKMALPPLLRHLLGYVLDHTWFQWLGLRLFLPLRAKMPRLLHPEEAWARDFVTLAFDELYDGSFYHEKSAWPLLPQIKIPVCIGTNWGNPGLHMRGAFQAWHELQAPKKLFIGPPEPTWPWENYQQELLAWYDYHLKGIDSGVNDLPAVRYWLQGANCWCEATNWPLKEAKEQRFYLYGPASDGKLSLQEQLPVRISECSFLAIPRGMMYPQEILHYETQVLRYSSAPFQVDTKVVGPITLHLSISSTAIDTHIIARVSDLAPDGTMRKLSFGWLQASHRKRDTQLTRPDEIIHEHRIPDPLIPGKAVILDLSLTPTANLFKVGHRLILDIGSRPDVLEATALEGFVYFPYEAPPYPARNSVFHGGDDPAYLAFQEISPL